jgi:uncharacterized protein YceK
MKHSLTTLALLLSGCATIYQAPTDGPIAELVFDIDSGGAFPAVAIFREAERCSQGGDDVKLQKVGKTRYQASTKIPANRDLSFMVLNVFISECVAISTFTPAEGQRYIASFWLNHAEGYCYSNLHRLTEAAPELELSRRHRKFTRPMTGSGAFCSEGDVPPRAANQQ